MRKPNNMVFDSGGCFYHEETGLVVNGQGISLKEAKKLQSWLSRMLPWLQQKYGDNVHKATAGKFYG